MSLQGVNLLSWILPNADTSHVLLYKNIGRMATALFYLEMLYKYGDDPENYDLKRIEARWRIVNEFVVHL